MNMNQVTLGVKKRGKEKQFYLSIGIDSDNVGHPHDFNLGSQFKIKML